MICGFNNGRARTLRDSAVDALCARTTAVDALSARPRRTQPVLLSNSNSEEI
jgi:hypothetical protein